MDKRFGTKYFPMFYYDLATIIDYIKINLNNVIAANNLLDEIEKEIEKRRYDPQNYEKYILKGKTYYRIYVKKYVIFYTIKDDVMEIRRILYGKRNFRRLI